MSIISVQWSLSLSIAYRRTQDTLIALQNSVSRIVPSPPLSVVVQSISLLIQLRRFALVLLIKLFICVCMSLMNVSFLSSTDAMYVSCEHSLVFAIVIRPFRDRRYGFHFEIIDFIRSFIF